MGRYIYVYIVEPNVDNYLSDCHRLTCVYVCMYVFMCVCISLHDTGGLGLSPECGETVA